MKMWFRSAYTNIQVSFVYNLSIRADFTEKNYLCILIFSSALIWRKIWQNFRKKSQWRKICETSTLWRIFQNFSLAFFLSHKISLGPLISSNFLFLGFWRLLECFFLDISGHRRRPRWLRFDILFLSGMLWLRVRFTRKRQPISFQLSDVDRPASIWPPINRRQISERPAAGKRSEKQ